MDNPPLNVIGIEIIEELQDTLENIKNSKVRGLIFKAEGDNFSAGADVNLFKDRTSKQAKEIIFSANFYPAKKLSNVLKVKE